MPASSMVYGVPPPTALTVIAPCPGHSITPGRDSETKGGERSRKSRRWMYTLNNYTDEECNGLVSLDCIRHVVGRETAPTTGTPHLQGYIRFKDPVRFSWWKNQFPRASVRVPDGTETQNAVYCSKAGSLLIDKGVNCDEVRPKMTREEETDEVIEEIEKGASYGQIRQRHKRFCFWHRRNVLDYMRDEQFLKDYPDANPTV